MSSNIAPMSGNKLFSIVEMVQKETVILTLKLAWSLKSIYFFEPQLAIAIYPIIASKQIPSVTQSR